MTPVEPEEGFKVIDGRQPDLTGLVMMLANSAAYALEEQRDAPPRRRRRWSR